MFLVRAAEIDFNRIREAYLQIIEKSPDMDKYARYEYGKHPKDDDIKAYIDAGDMYMLMNEEEIAGVAAVTFYQGTEYHPVKWQVDVRDNEVIVPHLLGIMPDYQKKGTGKVMMREIFNLARKNSLKVCRLDTLESNIPAQKLYKKMGFIYCGTAHWFAENTGWTNFYLYEYVLDK